MPRALTRLKMNTQLVQKMARTQQKQVQNGESKAIPQTDFKSTTYLVLPKAMKSIQPLDVPCGELNNHKKGVYRKKNLECKKHILNPVIMVPFRVYK